MKVYIVMDKNFFCYEEGALSGVFLHKKDAEKYIEGFESSYKIIEKEVIQ